MNKFAFILILVLLPFVSQAQETYEDVVYLKNGSIIHGMIIETVPNVSLKIKSGPNVFAYKLDEVEKIRKELADGGKTNDFKKKGYFGIVELGFTDFPAGSGLPMFSMNVVNGYQFNRCLSMGLGLGADISNNSVYNVSATTDFRGYFTKAKIAPFAGLIAGYNMQIAKYPDYYYYGRTVTTINHGAIINPNIGVRIAISKKAGMSFSFGYKMLLTSNVIDANYGPATSFGPTHGFVVKVGVNF